MHIRKAEARDAAALSELAYRSKAYWGYTEEFMEQCRSALTVSKRDIERDMIYLLEDKRILGFYWLSLDSGQVEAFFVDPDEVGKGKGQLLWNDLLIKARQASRSRLLIDSDPHAAGFYLKMGAHRIGDVDSTVFPGRKLPLLEVLL